ncbi:MAG TPA: twin-arginine translocation signal domain-containing protein [Thermomicrobiales bacterium]|nr:twin-arginine translocation signal domain-containing protein [Thermomicrobiales bacterium]
MGVERNRSSGLTYTSRRRFVRAVSATGALVASGYVKPDLRSLGVTGALAAVSGNDDNQGDNDNNQGDENQDGSITTPPGWKHHSN